MYRKNTPQWILLMVLTLVSARVNSQAEEQMNILFIAVDDLKPTLGCYGDTLAITPNIDSLASRGLLFSSAYCQQAVCAPSRASLMTSRYPDQTGVEDLQTMMREASPGITSLPEYLTKQGYLTTATGKIFDFRSVDDAMDAPSWSYPYRKHYDAKYYDPVNGKPSYYYASEHAKDTIAVLQAEAIRQGVDVNTFVREHYFPATESADVRYDGYVDGAILNAGVELLEEVAAKDVPFFLGVGFHRPHLPFVAPTEFWDLYDRSDFSLAPYQQKAVNSPDIAYHNSDELRSYTGIPDTGSVPPSQQLELIHGYYAAASYIDFLVGVLLERLDELGLRDNTIIVLWGDHGWHLGDHDLWCKHSNFEQATRVPLIFSVPGQLNPGETVMAPVEFTDVAPTLLDLTGTEIPVFFEGESLLPLFDNPGTSIREAAMSQYPRWNGIKGYSLRDPRYRYTKWVYEDGTMHSRELYDYLLDPQETRSYHNDAAYAGTRDRLDSMLMERIRIPSTQTRIGLVVKGVNHDGDTVSLPGAEVRMRDEKKITDQKGEAVFTHFAGNYEFAAKAKGYTPWSGNMHIGGDTAVHIFLSQESYEVTFSLVKGWNGQVLDGAKVAFGLNSGVTDSAGNVTFEGIVYDSYVVQVEFLKDRQQIFDPVVITSDTTIHLAVEQPVYEIEITVMDQYNGQPVQVAEVILNGVSKSTDYQGSTVFSEIGGTFPLVISKQYYQTMEGTITLPSEANRIFLLEPTHASVRIWVVADGSPVKEAAVHVGDESVITGGLGLAKFDHMPNQVHYNYLVSKEGWADVSGDFYLHSDTSMTIELLPLDLEMKAFRPFLEIYPNPAGDMLHLTFLSAAEPITVKIRDFSGKLVMEGENAGPAAFSMDISILPPGLFLVEATAGTMRGTAKFIKSD